MNLKEADGWTEGGPANIGALFTRIITKKYYDQAKDYLGANKIVFEHAIKGLQENQCQPTTSRICYDSSVRGWKDHTVTRLVGNLSSAHDSQKPGFEILINSARPTAESNYSNPFFLSIHENSEELEKRRRMLSSLLMVPAELAHFSFYASYLKKPEEFLKENQQRLGPNSTRIMNGLIFLQNVQLNTQKSGSCWIKQTMRCLLVNLYIELLTYRKELTCEEAWKEAKELYKRVQKAIAIPYVEQLLEKESVTPIMKESALREITIQKNH